MVRSAPSSDGEKLIEEDSIGCWSDDEGVEMIGAKVVTVYFVNN